MFSAEDGGNSTLYIYIERERERERIFGTICFRGRVQLNSGLGRPYPAENYQYTSLNMTSVYGPCGTHNGLKHSFSLLALFLNTSINKF